MLNRDHQGNPPKLHVTNLSSSATLASLREFFRAAGEVLEVEFAAERSPGGRATSAFVTMANMVAAEDAVRRFHGRLFHDRSVMVVIAGEGDHEAARRANAKPKTAPAVSVKQQYRERNGMAYELDCTGLRLTVRFSYQDAGCKEHRVELRATLRSDFVAEATATTRELALVAAAELWGRPLDGPPAPTLDWPAITTALKAVRAV